MPSARQPVMDLLSSSSTGALLDAGLGSQLESGMPAISNSTRPSPPRGLREINDFVAERLTDQAMTSTVSLDAFVIRDMLTALTETCTAQVLARLFATAARATYRAVHLNTLGIPAEPRDPRPAEQDQVLG